MESVLMVAAYKRTYGPRWLAWSEVGGCLALRLPSLHEPSELLATPLSLVWLLIVLRGPRVAGSWKS